MWAQIDPDRACDGRALGSASLPDETACRRSHPRLQLMRKRGDVVQTNSKFENDAGIELATIIRLRPHSDST